MNLYESIKRQLRENINKPELVKVNGDIEFYGDYTFGDQFYARLIYVNNLFAPYQWQRDEETMNEHDSLYTILDSDGYDVIGDAVRYEDIVTYTQQPELFKGDGSRPLFTSRGVNISNLEGRDWLDGSHSLPDQRIKTIIDYKSGPNSNTNG